MLKWKLQTKVDFWRGYNAIRPSVRPSVQTLWEGDGRLNINLTGELNDAIFSWRETHLVCYVNKR